VSLRRFAAVLLALAALFSAPAARAADPRLADLSQGRDDAPVTIVEYSSYTCPHCANFHQDNRPWLIDTYVKTGRAKLVFSDFPLDGLAMAASLLVHTAPREHAEALSEALFSEQRTWMNAANPRQALSSLAGLAGMPPQAVEAALSDEALFQGILDKRNEASKTYGIDSTPNLTINGKVVAANAPREELAAAIAMAEAAAGVKGKAASPAKSKQKP
jgi:protein-disulfide isomerase